MSLQRVLDRRRAERDTLIARAEAFVQQLDPALGLRAAAVFGSVARGDFNRWSDVDVLLIAEGFRGGALQRAEQLGDRPPLVQPIAWTPEEWRVQLARNNPIASEAVTRGVWIVGSPPQR